MAPGAPSTNRPKDERTPIEIIAIRQPAIMMMVRLMPGRADADAMINLYKNLGVQF